MSLHSFSLNQTSNTTHYRFVSCNCHQCYTENKPVSDGKHIAGLQRKQIFKKQSPPKQTQQLKP